MDGLSWVDFPANSIATAAAGKKRRACQEGADDATPLAPRRQP
jgi:hypothetical protein